MVDELCPDFDYHGTLSFCGSSSDDSLLEEILKNTTNCRHTHAYNTYRPDLLHARTHFHTHTPENNELEEIEVPLTKERKKSSGNKEAVRRYREKRKAHTAYLEEEVRQLRALNQQLIRKLQSQVALEAEVMRLKNLVLELKGRIDGEVGVLPCQRTSTECHKGGVGSRPPLDNFQTDRTTDDGKQLERMCVVSFPYGAGEENGDGADNLGFFELPMIR